MSFAINGKNPLGNADLQNEINFPKLEEQTPNIPLVTSNRVNSIIPEYFPSQKKRDRNDWDTSSDEEKTRSERKVKKIALTSEEEDEMKNRVQAIVDGNTSSTIQNNLESSLSLKKGIDELITQVSSLNTIRHEHPLGILHDAKQNILPLVNRTIALKKELDQYTIDPKTGLIIESQQDILADFHFYFSRFTVLFLNKIKDNAVSYYEAEQRKGENSKVMPEVSRDEIQEFNTNSERTLKELKLILGITKINKNVVCSKHEKQFVDFIQKYFR